MASLALVIRMDGSESGRGREGNCRSLGFARDDKV
jgi:hypothetical protein